MEWLQNKRKMLDPMVIVGCRARKLGLRLLFSDLDGSYRDCPGILVTNDEFYFRKRLIPEIRDIVVYDWMDTMHFWDLIEERRSEPHYPLRWIFHNPDVRSHFFKNLLRRSRHCQIQSAFLFDKMPVKDWPEIFANCSTVIFSLPKSDFGLMGRWRGTRNWTLPNNLKKALKKDKALVDILTTNKRTPVPAGCIQYDHDMCKWTALKLGKLEYPGIELAVLFRAATRLRNEIIARNRG